MLRGFHPPAACCIEIDGLSPVIRSTSGLASWPMNCRAYALSDSMYRRCPSAYSVSKAKLLFPLPETPVKQMSWLRGNVSETSRKLCSRAPLTVIVRVSIG